MTAKEITLDFIRDYCTQNNQKDWYNAQIKQNYPCKVYPKVNGKADKTQEPTVEMRRISFIQLKQNFIKAFFPDLAPKAKGKASTMYDAL